MIKLKQAVIVEGRYDKIKLSNLLDALILTTDGFGIFKDKEKQAFLRRLAREQGLIILTDSDSAGFLIRNFLQSALPPEQITHVYIPDLFGKEKRKRAPGKEGKLGVEGVSEQVLLEAFARAGVTADRSDAAPAQRLTTADLFALGLSGKPDSAAKRRALLQKLALPERLSASALLRVLNGYVTKEQFETALKEIGL
jgi:ribonuclease M5